MVLLFLKALASHEWDPLSFVLLTPSDISPGQSDNIGYDGRFVYHIAVNDFGDTTGLDEPNFRYQRILYPLLVKAISLGRPGWVPWVMLAINLAALAAGACLLGMILSRRGASPWWGLVVFFSVGNLIALRFDLLEPLALVFLLGGLLAFERGRLTAAALIFAAGGLAKEFVLLAPLGLAVYEWLAGRRRGAFLLFAALLPFALWYLFLVGRFGLPPEAVEKSRFYWIPLSGFSLLEDPISRWVAGLWAVFPAVGFGLWALADCLQKQRASRPYWEAGMVFTYAAVMWILPGPTWIDPLAVLRWALGFLTVLVIWLAGSHRQLLPYIAALWLPSGLMLTLIPGMF